MAKGVDNRDRVRGFRCPAALWSQVEADIAKHNDGHTTTHLTITEWMIRAVEERLKHRARGRASRRKKKGGRGNGEV